MTTWASIVLYKQIPTAASPRTHDVGHLGLHPRDVASVDRLYETKGHRARWMQPQSFFGSLVRWLDRLDHRNARGYRLCMNRIKIFSDGEKRLNHHLNIKPSSSQPHTAKFSPYFVKKMRTVVNLKQFRLSNYSRDRSYSTWPYIIHCTRSASLVIQGYAMRTLNVECVKLAVGYTLCDSYSALRSDIIPCILSTSVSLLWYRQIIHPSPSECKWIVFSALAIVLAPSGPIPFATY